MKNSWYHKLLQSLTFCLVSNSAISKFALKNLEEFTKRTCAKDKTDRMKVLNTIQILPTAGIMW